MKEAVYKTEAFGYEVTVDRNLGLLSVAHDGAITWDELYKIKNHFWGAEAVAIEVYPPQSHLVNSGNYRHLWKLGREDFWPDLLGPVMHDDRLQSRYSATWAEARVK